MEHHRDIGLIHLIVIGFFAFFWRGWTGGWHGSHVHPDRTCLTLLSILNEPSGFYHLFFSVSLPGQRLTILSPLGAMTQAYPLIVRWHRLAKARSTSDKLPCLPNIRFEVVRTDNTSN